MTLSRRHNGLRVGRWPQATFGDLFQELDQLIQPLNELSRSSIGTYHPMDLYETDDAIVVELAVPGVTAEELDISLEGRQVTIRGDQRDADTDGRRYWLRGMPRGEFSRTVTLPSGIDANAIDATVEQGVLRLTLPKAAEAMARKIAVKTAEEGQQVRTIESERGSAEPASQPA